MTVAVVNFRFYTRLFKLDPPLTTIKAKMIQLVVVGLIIFGFGQICSSSMYVII